MPTKDPGGMTGARRLLDLAGLVAALVGALVLVRGVVALLAAVWTE